MDVYSTISSLFPPGASGTPVHSLSLCYSCPAKQVTDLSLGRRLKKRQNLMKSMLLEKKSNNDKLNYKNNTPKNKTKQRNKQVFILYKDAIMLHIHFEPSCYTYISVFL